MHEHDPHRRLLWLRRTLEVAAVRHALLRAVRGRARQRQLDAFGDLLRVRPDGPYTVTLVRAWTSIGGPDGLPYLRMFGRLRESAEQRLWADFRRAATTDWLGALEEGRAAPADPSSRRVCRQ